MEQELQSWYVAQTKPRDEQRVIRYFALRGVHAETFLPKIEITRRRGGRRITTLEPLFPNYVFMHCRLDAVTWNTVRWTPGVQRILGGAVGPAEVPPSVVAAIKERTRALGFVRIGSAFSAGDRVRLRSGPFIGFEAMFERVAGRDRVRVLLEILGARAPLEVDIFDLEPV